MIANTDSTDLGAYTKAVTVYMDNGDMYSANLVSYTQVIDEDDDLVVFNVLKNNVVGGYYIVNNDIILDSFTGNTHGDGFGGTGKFSGVFDGDGHVWNTITLSNGKSYCVDVTQDDDGNDSHKWFLTTYERMKAKYSCEWSVITNLQ